MVWSLDLDDFKSFCSNKTYPLTRMVSSSLKELNRNKCVKLPRIDDIDITEYTSKVTKWTFSSSEKIYPQNDKFNYLPDKPKTTPRRNFLELTTSASTTSKKSFLTIRFRPQINLNALSTQATSKKLIVQNKPARPTLQSKYLNTTKTTIYLLSRSDKINTILLAYQNSKLKNEHLIDEIFKQIISNMSEATTKKTSVPQKYHLKAVSAKHSAGTMMPKLLAKKPESSNSLEENDNTSEDKQENEAEIKDKICHNLNDGEFVRDPSDCSSFYTCFLGLIIFKKEKKYAKISFI